MAPFFILLLCPFLFTLEFAKALRTAPSLRAKQKTNCEVQADKKDHLASDWLELLTHGEVQQKLYLPGGWFQQLWPLVLNRWFKLYLTCSFFFWKKKTTCEVLQNRKKQGVKYTQPRRTTCEVQLTQKKTFYWREFFSSFVISDENEKLDKNIRWIRLI